MEVNFFAVVGFTKAFLPVLMREPTAQIVNGSSLFGLIAPAEQTASLFPSLIALLLLRISVSVTLKEQPRSSGSPRSACRSDGKFHMTDPEVSPMRRMFCKMFVFAALLLYSVPYVSAQQVPLPSEPKPSQPTESVAPQAEETRVSLMLEARLMAESEEIPVLPMNVLERLTDQEALATLNMHAQGPTTNARGPAVVQVRAQFLFPSMERFRAWYEDQATQALLRELNAASPGALSLALNVHRNP